MRTEDIQNQYMESVTASMVGLEMVVMSILSDAQELMHYGNTEEARQYMNRAKYILSKMLEEKSLQVA
jgi:hypothetical protein